MPELPQPEQPLYSISVVARLVSVHPQTLRRYDDLGLVRPERRSGRRLYSQRDVARLHQIKRLVHDLGVNVAAVDVILRLSDQVADLRAENESMRKELEEMITRLDRAVKGRPSFDASQHLD